MMMGHVPADPGLVRTGAGISMMAGLGDAPLPASLCLNMDMAGNCTEYYANPEQPVYQGLPAPVQTGSGTGAGGAPPTGKSISDMLSQTFGSVSSAFPWLVIAAIAVLSSTGRRR